MKLIIKEVYSNFRVDKNSKAIFVGMLQGVLEGQQLDTLDYFVVTDPEAGEFEKAVSKYAAIVGTEANVTRDGSYRAEGKTLSGLGNDGRLHQTIIITSAICRQAIMEVAFMLGYLNMDEKTIHEKQLEQLYSVHLIVHEIGHAVDYENRYRMFGTVNTKSFYNLGNERERQEYFLENAFSLWGEYYAETFSFKNFNKTPNKNEGNLLWCIDSYFENQVNFYLERAYRIVEEVFEQIRDTPYSQVAENRIRQESNLQKTKRAAAEKKIKAAQHALERFEGEILKCLDGTSNFTEDMIAKQIRRYQQELDDAKAEYAELQNARLNEAAEIRKLRTYYDDFKGWAEEFDTAPLEMKRMILSHLIDRVEVGRKYQVIVKFNMKYRQFLECTAETYNTEIGA